MANTVLIRILGLLILFSIYFNSCSHADQAGPYADLYKQHCSGCHGKNMEGRQALAGNDLKYGDSIDDLIKSISEGYADTGMPGYQSTLSEGEIRGIAIYISEVRDNNTMSTFHIKERIKLPTGDIKTEKMNIRLEEVASDLAAWPFSIAPLPEGGFLLSEKMRGLTIISPEGEQSPIIEGLPKTSTNKEVSRDGLGLVNGIGWMLDVALHPDYEDNGWIYLCYGDRCTGCNQWSQENKTPVSMPRLVRGRIQDGKWIDNEVIWEVDKDYYTPIPETTSGGRIAFDKDNHVYISMGAKFYIPHEPPTIESIYGIQELNMPYGKIHRVNDDGSIPKDNPFVDSAGAIQSTWTYGHRSPHGLEVHPLTGEIWGTEMGPRGGDEVNLLKAGKNYGWPLTSKGVNYTGTKVDFGKYLGIEFDIKNLVQPVVDMTPSPAVSSFAVCTSERYPEWNGDLIVGSLKATELYRIRIQDGKLVHQETLIDKLARIRDVEVGFDGYLYLLLENSNGSKIVRMVPS